MAAESEKEPDEIQDIKIAGDHVLAGFILSKSLTLALQQVAFLRQYDPADPEWSRIESHITDANQILYDQVKKAKIEIKRKS